MYRPALALVLLLVFAGVGFGWRTYVQVRRHGDSGWRITRTGLDRVVGPALAIGFVLVGAGPFWALVTADAATPVGLSAVADSAVALLAGVILTSAAGLLTVVAQMEMGASWRIGVQHGEQTELITSGLFSKVRNPIFTGMLAFVAGLALLVPNLPTLAGAAVSLVTIVVQVRGVEEPNLLAVHGEPYRRWADGTGRFLPGLGRGI